MVVKRADDVKLDDVQTMQSVPHTPGARERTAHSMVMRES